jgi:hypothetical protein
MTSAIGAPVAGGPGAARALVVVGAADLVGLAVVGLAVSGPAVGRPPIVSEQPATSNNVATIGAHARMALRLSAAMR